MCITKRKLNACLLVTLLVVLIGCIVIGCSNSITGNEPKDTIGDKQKSYEGHEGIDELWAIGSQSGTRDDLSMEDIIRIIEENSDYYTIDGEIDVDLLRQFVTTYFTNVEVITDPGEIADIIRHIQICCKYNPATNKFKITIVRKK